MRPQFLIATEQLELPQLDKAGPSISDTAALQLHWSNCLSRETGPVGDIRGLSWVPPSCLQRSVFGGLNWKRENDVQGRYSVVKHNDPANLLLPHNLYYLTLLCCLHVSLSSTLNCSAIVLSLQFSSLVFCFCVVLCVFFSLGMLTGGKRK